ncbi:hypothetical protein [Rhizorhabdus dicambivorans]|nr:hypothetical protein [Rhizorhabdus dicambivorans]
MVRFLIPAFASAMLIAIPTAIQAAPCKDAKGKFITCPPPPAAKKPCKDAKGKFMACPQKPKVCKDAKGKFVKCGTPGSKAV